MKTKLLISVMAFSLSLSAFCQNTIVLTFEAEYYGTSVSTIDSIFIENLTQGGDTTLVDPDLTLDLLTGTSEQEAFTKGSFGISPNHPNPFTEKTTFSIFMPEEDLLQVLVFNSLGQKVLSYNQILEGGNHSFTFYPGTDLNYFVKANAGGKSRSIKLVSLNNFSGRECSLIYSGINNSLPDYKSQKEINNFVFSEGDTLRFIGYAFTPDNVAASDVMEDAPESNQTYTFGIIEGLPCPETPSVTYEGQTYTTVQIGDQCWFKQNLNVGTMVPGNQDMANNEILEKYCYNDEPDSCTKYGGLYQWDEMMQYTMTPGVQGICPSGWHIPTDFFGTNTDWCVLTQFIDPTVECSVWNTWTGTDIGTKIKSTTGWNEEGNGTNTDGFTVIPGGLRGQAGGFGQIGNSAFFWSSSAALPAAGAWGLKIKYDNASIFRIDYWKDQGFSVRCIKD